MVSRLQLWNVCPVTWFGMFLGPCLATLVYWLLPSRKSRNQFTGDSMVLVTNPKQTVSFLWFPSIALPGGHIGGGWVLCKCISPARVSVLWVSLRQRHIKTDQGESKPVLTRKTNRLSNEDLRHYNLSTRRKLTVTWYKVCWFARTDKLTHDLHLQNCCVGTFIDCKFGWLS